MTLGRRQDRHRRISASRGRRFRGLLLSALIGIAAGFQGHAADSPPHSAPGSPVAGQAAEVGSAPAKPVGVRPAAPARSHDALARERQKIDEVIAAAVVSALSDELGGRQVEIRLDPLSVQTSSLRDRLVRGRGQMQIEGADEWVGFSFDALYDAVLESAGYPELRIGAGGADDRVLPNDARLIRELDDRVIALVGQEFGYQQVRMQLDRITTIAAGARYLRIDAEGLADFGLDGGAPVHVEALYDRASEAWLRVAYVLQPGVADGLAPASPQAGGRAAKAIGDR